MNLQGKEVLYLKIGYIRIIHHRSKYSAAGTADGAVRGRWGLHWPYARQEYQPPRATKDDGVRSIVEQEDSTLCFENLMQAKTLTIRTEYDIFSIEMSKTSPKTKGRREKKRGSPGKEKKRIKTRPGGKPSEKSRMRGHFKRLTGMIWMRGRSESRAERRPKQQPAAAPWC